MNPSDAITLNNDRAKKKVLIVAYALSPTLGSEYRSAWELTNHIARQHDVTVLFGDSDALMGSFDSFDEFAKINDVPFNAIKIKTSERQTKIAKKMRKMPLALLFPILLKHWHRRAFKHALALHKKAPFDVAHQLGPIGFRNPGYLWKLNCHTYWGPIGGAQHINTKMIKNRRSTYFAESLFRNVSVTLQAYSPYIFRAARRFDRLSFATVENANYFAKTFRRSGPIVSDQGLYTTKDKALPKSESSVLRIAWAGSLTPRKNVDALIDIVLSAPTEIEFSILGGGSREEDIRALAARKPNVTYHGVLPRSDVMQVLKNSDAILLTSLSEANTAILFEAIENDCIPIAPKINGFVSVLNDKVAFLIEQENYNSALNSSLQAVETLLELPTRTKMLNNLRAHKPNLTWEAIADAHVSQYE